MSASDKFQHPPSRVHELWQTGFTYFRVVGWGWYFLSTIVDDYSRYIITWTATHRFLYCLFFERFGKYCFHGSLPLTKN